MISQDDIRLFSLGLIA